MTTWIMLRAIAYAWGAGFVASSGRYFGRVRLGATRFGNTIIGGRVEESMSSRAWRAEGNRKTWGRMMRPIIDALFLVFGGRGHCEREYHKERQARQPLPVIDG